MTTSEYLEAYHNMDTPLIDVVKVDPVIKPIRKIISEDKPLEPIQKILEELSNVSFLLDIMIDSPIEDLEFENIFKKLRAAILSNLSTIKNSTAALPFQVALSLQCLHNDYLYDQTVMESEAVMWLENQIKNKLNYGDQPHLSELICFASYERIHEYSWFNLLSIPLSIRGTELELFKRRHITEPIEEKNLKGTIPSFKQIKNTVSCIVQEQYDQSPYPKWSNGNLIDPTYGLTFPNIDRPLILIAGCGTGRHSISISNLYEGCHIVAVDLSLNSLAYAKRKTEELNISNIDYLHADILDLRELGRKFDIIECTGVLHHMEDPMAGWKVLTDCLKDEGFMQVGLYSELARRDITKIRAEIEQSNIELTYQTMKQFRNQIINSEEEHHKRIVSNPEFYNMSTCRDMLFHVQEHRFTIPQIKEYLSQLGLTFRGFELNNLVALDSLDEWDIFEQKNPNTFLNMYQFWVQKETKNI